MWMSLLGPFLTAIVCGFVCWCLYHLTGIADDYDGVSDVWAIVASVIAGLICFGLWFMVNATGTTHCITWWLIWTVVLTAMNLVVGFIGSWAKSVADSLDMD